ncbi:MAG: hypothetical protein AAF703_03245 [Cyanobacteria bacterium P01_D01_bin.105]
MKHILLTVATSVAFASSLVLPTTARAQEPILLAQRGLDCNVVESLGTSLSSSIVEGVNDTAAGERYRINRRKTLVINAARSVSFRGCNMSVVLDVTLRRKIRRNAHGTITLNGNISSFNLPRREVCYTGLNVSDVSLSRTLRIGEGVYRWAANKALPDSGCLNN